jgi:hypothetical protein
MNAYSGAEGLVGQAAEDAGGREQTAEAALGRRHAEQRGLEGPRGKEMVTPAAKRNAASHLRGTLGCANGRRVRLPAPAMSIKYQTTRADNAGARESIVAIAQERSTSGIGARTFRSGGRAI